ncbi:hypothetical protein [Montanilutibacter psychrotolerans]|uniref:hypothetical protein n=1 Tax=Montanilutibacter psychrotolerans TaxID=1327343 RepID=UPI0011CE4E8D|nr:hypothetical protein [Lysobacter psychrotolerans]
MSNGTTRCSGTETAARGGSRSKGVRVAAWLPLVCLALQASAAVPAPASPDADDSTQALRTLQQEILASPRDPRGPIQAVLAGHAIGGAIAFTVPLRDLDGDEDAPAPKPQQPAGMSDAEWQAFMRYWNTGVAVSNVDGEASQLNYLLLDIDDDGQRDLAVDYYLGGTGLFSQLEVLQRDPVAGFRLVTTDEGAPGSPRAFTINGRGSDQAIDWIRIAGRTWLAYRDGAYGQDVLTLHRPLSSAGARRQHLPGLRVDYRYVHIALPPDAQDDDVAGSRRALADDPQLLDATNRQLQHLGRLSAGEYRLDSGQRCPLPPTAPEAGEGGQTSEADAWPWRGAGHYTFDYPADFRVRTRHGCYGASLLSARSSYQVSYEHCCRLELYRAPGERVAGLPLRTTRDVARAELIQLDLEDGG